MFSSIKKVGPIVSIVLVLVLVAAAVSGYAIFGEALFGQADPEVLRIALVPAEDMEERLKAFEPMRQHLEKELGISIEMFKALDYTAVVEAMRAEKIEIAFFGPFSYVLAAERANARAIISTGDAAGKPTVYYSLIIAHKDSNLQNMDDIRARAGELTLGFVDPASTSGYMVPYGFMKSIGISPNDAFREVIFTGGHDAANLAVFAKKVDVAAVSDGSYRRAVDRGVITAEAVRVIWRSEGIPRSPIAVRGDLSESLIERIQQIFVDIPQKAPDAFEQWVGRRDATYVRTTTEHFDGVRVLARGLGKIGP